MKSYHGLIIGEHHQVWAKDGQSYELLPARSQALCNHSPDGFCWGYNGSGPAQLALAILIDFTGDEAWALKHYQQFKGDKIATFHIDRPFTLSGDEIGQWVQRTNEFAQALGRTIRLRTIYCPKCGAYSQGNLPSVAALPVHFTASAPDTEMLLAESLSQEGVCAASEQLVETQPASRELAPP